MSVLSRSNDSANSTELRVDYYDTQDSDWHLEFLSALSSPRTISHPASSATFLCSTSHSRRPSNPPLSLSFLSPQHWMVSIAPLPSSHNSCSSYASLYSSYDYDNYSSSDWDGTPATNSSPHSQSSSLLPDSEDEYQYATYHEVPVMAYEVGTP